ncbi:MAG: UbiX family flavin prenyltransferase [Thermoleophilia bacterium]|nr:UbiX family flavin prenyltransferase [Thermoleophilia bacterium]
MRRVIVGISGSTGPHYGVRLLEVLRELPATETHLILSSAARKTIEYELGRDPDEVAALASVLHDERNIGASIASGTFLTTGMIVAPCSVKTLSAIASSYNDNLIVRAADVCLKERRPLVLVVRETPLHAGHLRLMLQATEAGAVILPPVPGFYHRPQTIAELIDHTVVKVLDQLGLHVDLIERWSGLPPARRDGVVRPPRRQPDRRSS